jgi:uncharacterized protein (DUF58 family)
MLSVREALTPEAVARLTSMELRARAIVEGRFSGQHRSPYRGASVEFADHREYSPGDETRHIDWKVYGRRDRLFVKEFDAETNLSVHLLLDASRSMDFGAPVTKLHYAACLAAALALLANSQRDAAGLSIFDAGLRSSLPPQSSPAHLRRLFETLDAITPGGETDIAGALSAMAQSLTRRGLVVLVSDLLDEPEPLLRALGHFRHRGHDVAVLQVMDSAELSLGPTGPTVFEDLETGERLLTDPGRVRGEYQRALEHFLAQVREGCRSRSIDHVLLDTRRPYDSALTAFLGRRAHIH